MTTQLDPDTQSRILLGELAANQRALAKIVRELDSLKATAAHTASVLNATRAELAETRALFRNATKPADEPLITRLFHTRTYKPPKPSTITFGKDAPDPATDGPRIFMDGRELLGGRVSHVVRARDEHGFITTLPTDYDHASRFMQMPTPNRRKHWRGSKVIYGAMLDLCLRVQFAQRKGRYFVWAARFDVAARVEWLTQFRPPARVR